MRIIIQILFFVTLGLAGTFSNGVHLVNEDTTSYQFRYFPQTMSTRICFVSEPTETIKRGLAPLFTRRNNNLIPNDSIPGEMIGTIAPNSVINCLSAVGTTIVIDGYGEITLENGTELYIKSESIVLLKNDIITTIEKE